jgi:hypothetical protein
MTTTATELSTDAYQDLGAGPLMVQAFGRCKVATASALPDLSQPESFSTKANFCKSRWRTMCLPWRCRTKQPSSPSPVNQRKMKLAIARLKQQHDDPLAEARAALKPDLNGKTRSALVRY